MIDEAYCKFVEKKNAKKPDKYDYVVSTTISKMAGRFELKMLHQENEISGQFEWLSRSKKSVPFTPDILKAITNFFGVSIYGKSITGYTEIRKGEKVF